MTPTEMLLDGIGNKFAYAVIIGGLIGLAINIFFTILKSKGKEKDKKRNNQNRNKYNKRR